MSRLYYTESGHVIPSLGEELTRYRRARKALDLPPTQRPARLYVLARAYPENALPLRVAVNGQDLAPLAPELPGGYWWHELEVPAGALCAGQNLIELWTDAEAMDAWSLALEDGHRDPGSALSTDGGATWRDGDMGYLNRARGEYVVRIRLAEGQDPQPPAFAWETRDHPRLQALRGRLPPAACGPGSTLDRVRILNSWVSASWEYRNSSGTPQYAPWDAATILSWGKAGRGHDGRAPVVMCVHYSAAMVTCCLAAGIPARGAVFTEGIDTPFGHFTAEVWLEEYGKWIMVDPTKDAILFWGGSPMSVDDIRRFGYGRDLLPLIEWGTGRDYRSDPAFVETWADRYFRYGVFYKHRSVWGRNDFLSHPELTPPGHGTTAYCETGLVWEEKDLAEGHGMFPCFAASKYFDAPPAWG